MLYAEAPRVDVWLHGMNPAGLSAFNSVKRRMTPLSHDLAGIVFPYNHFGNHIDSSGKKTDREIEEKNFQMEPEVLSEVWEKTVIDGHSVNCRAIPADSLYKSTTFELVWVVEHCQQFRYCLQIVKCQDPSCCLSFETNWFTVIPDRFTPLPSIYEHTNNGSAPVELSFQNLSCPTTFAPLTHCLLVKAIPEEGFYYDVVPFELYCRSMKEVGQQSL